MHDAFTAALERWPRDGVPANPRAWLVSTGRFKAIDALRRRARFDASLGRPGRAARRIGACDDARPTRTAWRTTGSAWSSPAAIRRCRPTPGSRSRCARSAGSRPRRSPTPSSTSPPTVAQRIVRAKAKIRDARIPYQVPVASPTCPTGSTACCTSSISCSTRATRRPRARRSRATICRPRRSAWAGCWSSSCPSPDPRRSACSRSCCCTRRGAPPATTDDGELVLLDRPGPRRAGTGRRSPKAPALVERALRSRRIGPYTLQAAIAAVHADAPSAGATDWRQIVGLYDVLLRVEPTPVVELNRAAAVAMRDGPAAGPRADRRHPRPRRARGLPSRALGPSGPLPPPGAHRRGAALVRARAGAGRGRSRSGGSWPDAWRNWTEGRKRSSGRRSPALAQPTPSGQSRRRL